MQELIDRDGRVPIYHQVVMNIEQRVAAGEWDIGDRLPSERELAEAFKTSRTTMRQALTVLEQGGILRRERPGGTFVIGRPEKLAPTINIPVSFVKSLIMAGHATTIATSSIARRKVPTTDIAKRLRLPKDGFVIQFDRLVLVEGKPMANVCSLVPESICPALSDVTLIDDSIHTTILQLCGIRVVEADHWIESNLATTQVAESLDIEPGNAILQLVSVYYDDQERPIEYVTTYWRADVMKLHLRSRIGGEFSTSES